MFNVIWTVHIALCLLLIGLVMLQQGKGADAGAVTSATSNPNYGPTTAGNVITRITTALAICFMLTSFLLVKSYNARTFTPRQSGDVLSGSVMEGGAAPAEGAAKTGTAPEGAGTVNVPPVPADKPPAAPADSKPQAPGAGK